MPRKNAPFKSYEGDKQKDKHIRKTATMMLSDNYLSLSNSAKVVYDYMKLWACGETEFEYSQSRALMYMSNKTFVKARDELEEKGFIEYVATNQYAHIPNKYKFSDKWKKYKQEK